VPKGDVTKRGTPTEKARDRFEIIGIKYGFHVAKYRVFQTALHLAERRPRRPEIEIDAMSNPTAFGASGTPGVTPKNEIDWAERSVFHRLALPRGEKRGAHDAHYTVGTRTTSIAA
jgi:hypothetical protein